MVYGELRAESTVPGSEVCVVCACVWGVDVI